MCEFLIFNTQKKVRKAEKFWQLFGNNSNFLATFWQLLDTFISNFFGIHRQLVAKPSAELPCQLLLEQEISNYVSNIQTI